jgi:predicted Ser/Thr protein kinase
MPLDSDSPSSGLSSQPRRVAAAAGDDATHVLKRSSDSADATVLSPAAGPTGSSLHGGLTPPLRRTQSAVQEVGRALEGTTLGVYELEQFVGGGGMGAVFRARDTTLDRTVAVKVLFAESSADEELVRRFRNEAQSAARLDHENIGRVHAVGYEGGWHFIVFEYIEGRNLRELVSESGPFDVPRTVAVAVQIAVALAHASEREVVHRDIKPSNIIITPDGQAKLVDMGLARLHQVSGTNDLTVSGMTLGTFDYISPEQARDPRGADVRSDLYSLGCTLYFLLAGRPPFAEGTMVQKLLQHQQDVAVPIGQIRPDVPRKLAAAVTRLMEKSPDDRYPHPLDLVADLAGLADELGVGMAVPRATAVAPSVVTPWRLSDHVPWLVPVAAFGVIVAALFWKQGQGRSTGVSQPPAQVAATAGTVIRPPVGRLAEAVTQAKDGDVLEIESISVGVRVEPAFSISGKRVVIRAADGTRPTLSLATPESSGGERVGRALIPIESGSLVIEGIDIRCESPHPRRGESLFLMKGASELELRDASVELAGDVAEADLAGEPPVVIDVEGSEEPVRRVIRFERATVSGDATVIRAFGAGEIAVTVSSSQVTTARRFLVVEGGASSGAVARLSLDRSFFACDEGLVCLLDAPARPMFASLFATARASRFVVPQGAALVVQSGIETPEAYQAAVEWIDAGSRYEGSDIYRRIDGAAERIDIDFAAAAAPMEHSSRIGPADSP